MPSTILGNSSMKSELSILELIFKCLSASPPLKSTKAILVINKLSSIQSYFLGALQIQYLIKYVRTVQLN